MNGLGRVLILDDEERIRRLLADALEDHEDLNVRAAESAEQALELLARQPADVAVVDLRLPGMDGAAFIQEAHRRGLCRRFLLHSGSLDLTLSPELRALGMGEEDVLLKPSGVDLILARIRALLKR